MGHRRHDGQDSASDQGERTATELRSPYIRWAASAGMQARYCCSMFQLYTKWVDKLICITIGGRESERELLLQSADLSMCVVMDKGTSESKVWV